MAKNTQPIAKRCEALGISPAVMGYNGKKSTKRTGKNQMRRKKSDVFLCATRIETALQEKDPHGGASKGCAPCGPAGRCPAGQ